MTGTIVKICGIRTVQHARVAAEAGADMVGLVLAESKRRVTPEEAQAITRAAYTRRPRFVGLFVDEDPDTIGRLAGALRFDLVQLCGDESPEWCARLRVPYWKVVHVHDGMPASSVLHIAMRYPGAEAIVLDHGGTGAAGGTGRTIDHAVAAEVVRGLDRPVVLAGGLRSDTIAEAIRRVRPWGVDVSSGVERDGIKDEVKIRTFVKRAKGVPDDE